MLGRAELENKKRQFQAQNLDLEQERAKVRLAYKEGEAREQLKRLLVNLKVFDKVLNQEDQTLHNLGIAILQDMGFLDYSNISLIVDYLFTLPLMADVEESD